MPEKMMESDIGILLALVTTISLYWGNIWDILLSVPMKAANKNIPAQMISLFLFFIIMSMLQVAQKCDEISGMDPSPPLYFLVVSFRLSPPLCTTSISLYDYPLFQLVLVFL